jgi:hypothetical protein
MKKNNIAINIKHNPKPYDLTLAKPKKPIYTWNPNLYKIAWKL